VFCCGRSALSAGSRVGEWSTTCASRQPCSVPVLGQATTSRRPAACYDSSSVRSSADHGSPAREYTTSRLSLPPIQSRVWRLRTSRAPGDCAVPPFTMRGRNCACRRLLSCHRVFPAPPFLRPRSRFRENGSHAHVVHRRSSAGPGMMMEAQDAATDSGGYGPMCRRLPKGRRLCVSRVSPAPPRSARGPGAPNRRDIARATSSRSRACATCLFRTCSRP
jgi:hypothetical protein